MKLSATKITQLKQLLDSELGLKYTDQEARDVAMAILRYVLYKQLHAHITNTKDEVHAPRH